MSRNLFPEKYNCVVCVGNCLKNIYDPERKRDMSPKDWITTFLPHHFTCYFVIHNRTEMHREGTVAQWLRHYATNRQVSGLITDGVIGIFQ